MALPEEGVEVRLDAGKEVIRCEEPRVVLSLHPRLSVGRVERCAQPVGQTHLGKACEPTRRSKRERRKSGHGKARHDTTRDEIDTKEAGDDQASLHAAIVPPLYPWHVCQTN